MDGPMDLICHVTPEWAPRIRPASPRRDWMDATPEAYAYRCLPLGMANSHGWEILSPCSFSAVWDGGPSASSLRIDLSEADHANFVPVSLFGAGILTFHIEGIIRTPDGWNLWAGGPPNSPKDGIAPLTGLVETDWSPYTFTMNWMLTRPNHPVRFEEDEPFCFFFPVPRGLVEQFQPTIAPISEEPGLGEQFQAWSESRLKFHREMELRPPADPSDRWQKLYYRGVYPDGATRAAAHEIKLRAKPFVRKDGAWAARRPQLPLALRQT